MTYEEAVSFDNLYESMCKCRNGVMWKDSTSHFVENAIVELSKLEDSLQSETYVPRKPYKFLVTHPKQREIVSISFRDRVYQRSLNDNIIYPTMTRSFILDNYACQKGKGTDFARDRFKEHLRRFYHNHKNGGYILQLDIKSYYPNMPHDYAENLLTEKLDEVTAQKSIDVLRAQYGGDRGYNPGSQLVQIIGISALDKLDHLIKEKFHAKYYGRYMDDLFIIHHDIQFLREIKGKIENELNNIGMILSRKKTKIRKLSETIGFLGFDFRLTDSGKILMIPSKDYIKQTKKHLRNMILHCVNTGEITKADCDAALAQSKSYMEKGNAYYACHKLDRYYYELWRKISD